MNCCVCWEPIPSLLHAASFFTEEGCRAEHALCVKCYVQCVSCPLCRYHPVEKPLSHAEAILEQLRKKRHDTLNRMNNMKMNLTIHDNVYNDILTEMTDIKTIINSSYLINP
jgi:hypothetical protein